MVERLRVALLFGGRSAEHDVSVLSAGNVFRALDPARYETIPIGITRSGTWLLCSVRGRQVPGRRSRRRTLRRAHSGRRGAARDPARGGRRGARCFARGRRRLPGSAWPLRRGRNGPGPGRDRRGALRRLGRARLGRGDGQGCRQAADARRRPADRALRQLQPRRRAVVRGCRGGTRPSPVRQAGSARFVGRHQQGRDAGGVR